MSSTNNEHYFLANGGEMGKMMRAKDWSKTSLGNPETWPNSLQTMVSVMVNNPFGMYIAWGENYIQLYNDRFRPILGATKHPEALGISSEITFSEIWDIIGPMFQNVMKGESISIPDFMVPLDRNGFIEECYFDFSYCPIKKENGEVGGILVTVIETTEKKKSAEALKESNVKFISNIKQAPVGITILRGADFIVEMANEAYLRLVGRKEETFVGKPLFDSLPEVEKVVSPLLKDVLETGISYHGNELPIPLNRYGVREEIYYFDFLYSPLKEENGAVSGIIVTVTDVTEKVESKIKTLLNEERLNIIVEASQLGTWELYPKTSEFIYSKRYIEIVTGNKEIDKLTHEQLLKYLHPADVDIRNKAFQDALKTGNLHYITRLIWDDKSIRWVEARGSVSYDAEKQPERLLGTIRDITEEKNYQQEIEESEKRFRSLTESLPQLIWEADEKGNSLFASVKWIEYTGIHPKNDEDWKSLIHPDDYEENIRIWNHSAKTGEAYRHDLRIKNKNDGYRWHTGVGEPVLDKNNEIIKWVGAFTDIQNEKAFTHELEQQVSARTKELIQINETLRKSEERYHLMVEEVQDYAILYLNHEGIVENWNVGAQKIKGYKAEEIIGRHFASFYTEEDRKINLPQKLLQLAREKGKAVQQGWRVRKDKSLFWASVVITAVHNKQNDVIGFSKVTHDLTEKKRADDKLKLNALELEQKNIELEQINKELQSFTYISSHDLQEPLRKIQTFASLIVDKELNNLSENGKDKFQRIQSAAQRMQTLINDLLSYSRTNVQERIFEKTDLSEIINAVREDLKEELEQKNGVIENNESQEVNIIPFQFRQLIYNLASNSIKFAKQDSPPHIKIISKTGKGKLFKNDLLSPEKNYCHISISDNGIGFDQQYNKKIFDVFQRLHGRELYNGTGIGLAIVKKIVENHNGFISANGEVDKGATFDIYIPAD